MQKNKNFKKKLAFTGLYLSLVFFFLYLINKLIFFISLMKEHLFSEHNHYYKWRFGNIYYTKQGTGSPLLLIHDLNCSSSECEWEKVVNEFSKKHTVYTLDLIGCGRSEKPKITYTNYLFVQLISDFVKNVIKHKTDIVVTGYSSFPVIMACYIDKQLFNHVIMVNPPDIHSGTKYPKYRHKLLKYFFDCPIIGTFAYSLCVNYISMKSEFKKNYFIDTNLASKYAAIYHESSHIGGSAAKYLYSNIHFHYTNINVIHAFKQLDHNLCIIGGSNQNKIKTIMNEYIQQNPCVETTFVTHSKYLPQIENSKEFFKTCEIYLE